MADTIVRTFSLLTETDRKLEEMTKATYRRNKGDVIDWLVAEGWGRMSAADATVQTMQPAAQPQAQ